MRDERVLAALRQGPREAFVDEGFEEFAHEDSPLPIGSGRLCASSQTRLPGLGISERGHGGGC